MVIVPARDIVTVESMTETKFPDIDVQLTGNDGNAFAILGNVSGALRRAKDDEGKSLVSKKEIDEFIKDATSGDYNHVLQTCMKWVNVN